MTAYPGAQPSERIAYYLGEAERVERLADEAPLDPGRESFREAAREYRLLATWYGADLVEPEEPVQPGPGVMRIHA